MRIESHIWRRGAAAAALICGWPLLASAQAPGNYARVQGPGNYEDAYARYLAAARRTPEAPRALWMIDLTSDITARRVNDLVTIRVLEVLSASGTADSNLGKTGSASASLPDPAVVPFRDGPLGKPG